MCTLPFSSLLPLVPDNTSEEISGQFCRRRVCVFGQRLTSVVETHFHLKHVVTGRRGMKYYSCTPFDPLPSLPLHPSSHHPSLLELLGRYSVQCCHLHSEMLSTCLHIHPLSLWPHGPGGTVPWLEAGAVERDQIMHRRLQHIQSRGNVLKRRRG